MSRFTCAAFGDKRLKTSTRREAEGQIRHARPREVSVGNAKRAAFRVQTLHICILLSSVCRNIIFRPRACVKEKPRSSSFAFAPNTPRGSFLVHAASRSRVSFFVEPAWYSSAIDPTALNFSSASLAATL